jgi:Icc-related predicted phosphoesterase
MKLWHISDTHGYHDLLAIPEDIDIAIHSGDFSNYYNLEKNEPEALAFIHWFGKLPIQYKVLIAGNHDAYAFHHKKQLEEWCKHYNINYLENDYVTIEGVKIFGSPNTPTFNNWYFMKSRDKMYNHWDKVDEDTDVFVVHGPPKGILDLSYNRANILEYCGCTSLRKHILDRIKPQLCLFGHIHNSEDIINAGVLKLSAYDTIFSNGSVVTDRKFGKLSSNGNILSIQNKHED